MRLVAVGQRSGRGFVNFGKTSIGNGRIALDRVLGGLDSWCILILGDGRRSGINGDLLDIGI